MGHETRTQPKLGPVRLSDSTETGTVRKNLKTGEGIVSSTGGKWSNCSARECLSRDETADA